MKVFRNLFYLICLLGVFFLFNSPISKAANGTEVIGQIPYNSVWTPENSPYILKGNISIYYTGKLTILPGTQVIGNGYKINGKVDAKGTADSKIYFNNTVIYGPSQSSTGERTLELDNCVVYGGSLLSGQNGIASVSITNSLIYGLNDRYASMDGTSVIEKNTFISSDLNLITPNDPGENTYVRYNTFYNPYENAISILQGHPDGQTNSLPLGKLYIQYNNFIMTNKIAIRTYTLDTPGNLLVDENYWNSTNENFIKSSMIAEPRGEQFKILPGNLLTSPHANSTTTYMIPYSYTSPTQDNTQFDTNTPIVIGFSENIKSGTEISNVKLDEVDSNTNVPVTTEIIGKELIIKPNSALNYGRSYKVSLPIGAVISDQIPNSSGNVFKISERGILNFKTKLPDPVKIQNVLTSVNSPQPNGKSITVIADASGGMTKEYQFWLNDGTGWIVTQPYSINNQWTWLPITAGTYKISVYVKDKLSGKIVDDYKVITYQIINEISSLKITGLSATTNTAKINQPIKITTDVTGGGIDPLYQFWVDNGSGWKVVQSYSNKSHLDWTPSIPGSYRISVYVRDRSSSKLVDDYKIITVNVFDISVTKITSVTTSVYSPQTAGITIKLTAETTGGSEKRYQFWINDGSGWKVVQTYSNMDFYNWTPDHAGSYLISVYVRDVNSKNNVDDHKIISYNILPN